MKIKKGDKVKVITGSSKGSTGEVLKALPKSNQLIVEGVNLVKKNLKPTQANPDGGAIEAPIHVSNVTFLEVKAKKADKSKKEPKKAVKAVKEEKKPAKKTAKKADKE
jgi:large subunit ribosomal protein L24